MRILVVDDELSMREYLEILLTRWGHEAVTAATVAEAAAAQDAAPFDLVVTDMKLGNDSGLRVLKNARLRPMAPEVIVITAFGTPATAIEAIREGAYDYIGKPFDNEEFRLLVERALEKRQMREENDALRKSLGTGRLVWGQSEPMARVATTIAKVAASPRATVLVMGESGTGKELVARAVHLQSGRAAQPFIPINCAALTESLLESELFGHVKGAFTGAVGERTGLLVSAGQGTVFLDEIGEISAAVQVKLLRVLQERKVRPVGSSTEVGFDARIIAATNKSLEGEVKAGRFREDLFYRLNVITIEMPPLRARAADIPVLAKHFLARAADELGRPGLYLEPKAIEVLTRYRFPGNVRELQNVIERAATLAEGEALDPSAFPPRVRGEEDAPGEGAAPALSEGFSLEQFLDAAERRYLLAALKEQGGVKIKAAKALGLTFRSFRYRLAKHGLGDGEE